MNAVRFANGAREMGCSLLSWHSSERALSKAPGQRHCTNNGCPLDRFRPWNKGYTQGLSFYCRAKRGRFPLIWTDWGFLGGSLLTLIYGNIPCSPPLSPAFRLWRWFLRSPVLFFQGGVYFFCKCKYSYASSSFRTKSRFFFFQFTIVIMDAVLKI